MKVLNRYYRCIAANSDSNRVKLIRALFNHVMEEKAHWAAELIAPLPYEEMERVLKDILIGNGVSAEFPGTGKLMNTSRKVSFLHMYLLMPIYALILLDCLLADDDLPNF